MKKSILSTVVIISLLSQSIAFCESTYNALDYVTLGNYKGIEVTLIKVDVDDKEVQEQIDTAIQSNGKMTTLKEGTVEEGDVVVIDFEGKLNGNAFDGGTANDYELEIGSGNFLEDFEYGLIGVDVGETVDLNLTFPENYGNSELAGQDVVFTVTVNEIERMPELTDELAAELNQDCNTVDEYREYIKEIILENKRENQYNQMLNDLYTQIYNSSTINGYPENKVNSEVESLEEYYKYLAQGSGMSFTEFLFENFSMTEQEFERQAIAIIQSDMEQELLMTAIAEQEGLEIDDSYFEENIDTYVEMSGAESREVLIDTYGEDMLRQTMLGDLAMNFVVESCIITNPEDATWEINSNTQEILFRNIPWGTSYSEVQQLLPDFDWYDMSFDYMKTYPYEQVLTDETNDSTIKFENSGINMIALPFTQKETVVAGYTTSDIELYFAYTVQNGTLTKEDSDTALYGARYTFTPHNLKRMSADLIDKLSSLYGEPDRTTSNKDLWGNQITFTWWYGANNTAVVLRALDSSEDTSDLFDDELWISYAWKGGDNLLKAADQAISEGNLAKESLNYGNNDTYGL